MVRRDNGDFDCFVLLVSAHPLLFPLTLLGSESAETFQRLPWAGAWTASRGRSSGKNPVLSFRLVVVLWTGEEKERQFHALLAAKISLYFESVQRRPFQSSWSIKLYINLKKSFLQKPDFLTVAFYNLLAGCVETFYPTQNMSYWNLCTKDINREIYL